MGFRGAFTFVSRPLDAARDVTRSHRSPSQVATTVAFIVAEALVMASCIQYWWFGQLYPRSTVYLVSVITILSLVPTLHARPRAIPGAWVLTAKLHLLPSVASIIIIVAFRLGFVDHIDRYLYRSPLLVSLVLSFMIAFLVLKSLYRRPALERMTKGRRVVFQVTYTILDATLMTAFALFLINFEAIILVLP